MKNSHPTLTALLVVIGSIQSLAQKIDLDWVEIADNKVVVHYNLGADNSNREYLVNLFTSQDNFTKELTKVSGDVGTEVKPGQNKKITWDITKELGSYKGNISFEVRGRVYVPFVKLKDFGEGLVFKRGTDHPVVWTSGNLSGQVNIELYKGDVRVSGDNNQPNVGKFDWLVPSTAKKGNDYKLKFTNTKDRSDVVYSAPFTIKPKIPLAVKVLGVALVGGAIAILSGGGGSSGSPTSTPAAEKTPGLVSPPGTPDGN